MHFTTRTSLFALALVSSLACAGQSASTASAQALSTLEAQVSPQAWESSVATLPIDDALARPLTLTLPTPPGPLNIDLGPVDAALAQLSFQTEALMAVPVELQPLMKFAEPQHDRSSSDPNYAGGMKAMDDGRWADAVSAFDKVAAAHGDHAEAALYWKAYSLQKLGKKNDASAACQQLASSRPSSSWNRECLMLNAQSGMDAGQLADVTRNMAQMQVAMDEANQRTQEAMAHANARAQEALAHAQYSYGDGAYAYSYGDHSHSSDDDIKLIALNSLMQQEPAKALPALKSYILSNRPIEDRRRALFVLSRSKSPEAQALLTEIANGKTDPELQRTAIQTISTSRGKQAGPDLVSIYRNAQDKSVKRAAVSGLYVAHDASDLVELARTEKDMDMKRDIVSQLALMHDPAATAYMEELLK